MTVSPSRAVMAVAVACLGDDCRDWAAAMQGEFEVAVDDGRPLAFAFGCLIAAWREMPKRREGRLVLASHALALGLLLPMAALQFGCAIGLPSAPPRPEVVHVLLAGAGAQSPYLLSAQMGAVPALSLLWFLLGAGQLRLAWLLLEREWWSALKVGALLAAVVVTMFIFMQVLFLDTGSLAGQAGAIAVEFGALLAAARCHSELCAEARRRPAG